MVMVYKQVTIPTKKRMNLNFIFSALVALDFTVNFHVSPEDKQDYFMFSGPNSTAHLFRENHTICLYLETGRERTLSRSRISGPTFTFTWSGKMVNNEVMSNSSNLDVWFDAYTFFSPVLMLNQQSLAPIEPIFQCDNINYKLIALIIFCIGVGLKFDVLLPILLKLLKKESPYVTMR